MQGKLLYKICLVAICCGLSVTLFGQLKFYTQVTEAQISVGQTFQVQYIAEGATDTPVFFVPSFSQFTIHDTFENKSTSIQSPGLKMVESFSKIIWLSAKKAGTYTIPGATAIINGKKMRSNPVKVIIKARAFSVPLSFEKAVEPIPITELSELKPGDDIGKRVNDNLFLRAESNKTSCYAGEALVLTYKMYSRLNTTSRILKRPSLIGLSIIEMVDSYDLEPEIEKVNRLPYYVNLVRKVQGFPLQPGIMQLDIAEVSSNVHFVKMVPAAQDKTRSFDAILPGGTNQLWQRTGFDHVTNLISNSLTIQVKPLPLENQPANFSGAVGKFNMSVRVLQKDVHPGDLVKILVKVEGAGNIPLIVAPEIKWPIGVDTAEPAVKEDFNKYIYPLQGFKSFEYSFTAPDTGKYIIPATSFVYFNPSTHSYEESRSDSITLNVTPGAGKKSAAGETHPALIKSDTPLQLYWFAVVVVIILGWVGYQFARGSKAVPQTLQKEEVKPISIDVDLLEKSRTALLNENILLFYHELEKALWLTAADYSKELPSALNKRNIAAVLSARGVEKETVDSFASILNECEWALYAPDHEISNAGLALEKAEGIVNRLRKA